MRRGAIRLALWILRRFANLRLGDEARDAIAYLEKRRRKALAVARSEFDQDGRARAIATELDVLIGDFRAGLHHGEAETQAQAVGSGRSAKPQARPGARSGASDAIASSGREEKGADAPAQGR